MNLKKGLTIAAATGALAAISVPAMAFENEFHGMYKLKYFLSNYETGTSAGILQYGPGTVPTTVPATPVALAPLMGAQAVGLQLNGLGGTTENRKNSNYFEQRARLQYIAKASDDLRLVTHFEIDSVFGDRAQGGVYGTAYSTSPNLATRGSGGALEADAVNLETKHVYLDFKIPSTPTRVTAGIQPIKDVIKGILLDADIAGIYTSTKLGAATIGAGYFRAYDQSYFSTNRPRGLDNLDILALTGNYAINKNVNVGLGYYFYGDSRNQINATGQEQGNRTHLHTTALYADGKIGKVSLSGFAAMQQGSVWNGSDSALAFPAAMGGLAPAKDQEFNAFAFNIAAKAPVGPGTLRTAYLWTTGDDGRDGIRTGWTAVSTSQGNITAGGTSGNSYNESGMMLLNRNVAQGGTSTDQNIIYETGNRSSGMHLLTMGYDANITPKWYANGNLGFAWAAKNNMNTPTDKRGAINGTGNTATTLATTVGGFATGASRNASNFMGTEINLETGYKMYDNLTASFQFAYVFLGGYYANSVATNPSTTAYLYGNTAASVQDPNDPYTARFVLSYAF